MLIEKLRLPMRSMGYRFFNPSHPLATARPSWLYHFRHLPRLGEISLGLLNHANAFYPNLESEARAYVANNDINVLDDARDIDNPEHQRAIIKHLVVTKEINEIGDIRRLIELNRRLYGSYLTTTYAFVYGDPQLMHEAGKIIETIKSEDPTLSFLYPNTRLIKNEQEYGLPSALTIHDALWCDTRRIKYTPNCLNNRPVHLPNDVRDCFIAFSRIYRERHMYFRSNSDGMFVVRHGDGVFVTATKTMKDDLDLERIVYVHHYDENTNVMTYSGEFLPSSDVVEALILCKEQPDITAIFHSHATQMITRVPKIYDHLQLLDIDTYGSTLVGYKLAQALKNNPQLDLMHKDCIIIKHHGEYFLFDEKNLNLVAEQLEQRIHVFEKNTNNLLSTQEHDNIARGPGASCF